jgi:hypothetical protein
MAQWRNGDLSVAFPGRDAAGVGTGVGGGSSLKATADRLRGDLAAFRRSGRG